MAGEFDILLLTPAGGFDVVLNIPATPTVLSENRRRTAVMMLVLNAMPIADGFISNFDRRTAGWLYPLGTEDTPGAGGDAPLRVIFMRPMGILGPG